MTTSVRPSTPKQQERVTAAPRPERRTPSRVLLQRRAPEALRRHVIRGFVRVGILLVGDAVAFVALRAAIRAIRDGVAFGAVAAEWASQVVPLGFLGGWQ
ncbi:MAG: hypothetical protein WD043_11150, partial [Gemmatimonadales bacterium]